MQTFEEKVIDAFQVAGAALQQFEKTAGEQASVREKVAAQIPDTVKALLDSGMIEPEEKEACIRALGDPVQALVLLKTAAQYRATPILNGQQVDKNGRPAGTVKEASAKVGGGYVGRRGAASEAWDKFGVDMGLPVG